MKIKKAGAVADIDHRGTPFIIYPGDPPRRISSGSMRTIVELSGCKNGIDDHDKIITILGQAVEKAGGRVLENFGHRFTPCGVSHVTIGTRGIFAGMHTWPESKFREYASIVIHGQGTAFSRLPDFLRRSFKANDIRVVSIRSGLNTCTKFPNGITAHETISPGVQFPQQINRLGFEIIGRIFGADKKLLGNNHLMLQLMEEVAEEAHTTKVASSHFPYGKNRHGYFVILQESLFECQTDAATGYATFSFFACGAGADFDVPPKMMLQGLEADAISTMGIAHGPRKK